MEQGKFAEACPMLVESNQVDPAVGTLLYLGECYERIGQTASAWATFQAAAEAARKAAQPEREKMARDRAIALIGQLSKLAVTVGAAARVPGLEVRRDGVELREASWGIGVPVDPGEHTVTAKAPGKQDWSQKIRVEAGGGTTTAEIARLDDAAPPPQPAPPPVAPAPALRAPVPAPPVGRERHTCSEESG
jgi:serine/threonine-protein kinase